MPLSSTHVVVGTNLDKTGYTASTVQDKTGYSVSAVGDKTGYTVSTVQDKTGYFATTTANQDKTGYTVSSNQDKSGYNVTSVSDKTGYSLTAGSYVVRSSSSQMGTININTGASNNTSISGVTVGRCSLAQTGDSNQVPNTAGIAWSYLTMASSTVTATRYDTSGDDTTAGFSVVEFT
jgi:hypothetical protein